MHKDNSLFSSGEEILTRKQVAQMLKIGITTLDIRISSSLLPRIKIGKSVRFLRSDVETFILQQRICGGEK